MIKRAESSLNHTLSTGLLKVNLKSTAEVSVKAKLEDKQKSPSTQFPKDIPLLMEVKLQLLKQNYRKIDISSVGKLDHCLWDILHLFSKNNYSDVT